MALEVHRGGVAVNIKGLFVRWCERDKFVLLLERSANVLVKRAKRPAMIRITGRRGACRCVSGIAIAEVVATYCTADFQVQSGVSGKRERTLRTRSVMVSSESPFNGSRTVAAR